MHTVSCKSVPVAFSLFVSSPLSPSVGGAAFVGVIVALDFFALGGAVLELHFFSMKFFLIASLRYQGTPAQIRSVVYLTLSRSSAKLLC